MKTLAAIACFALASCAGFEPWSAETQFGTVSQNDKGELVIVPVAKPIVIPTK